VAAAAAAPTLEEGTSAVRRTDATIVMSAETPTTIAVTIVRTKETVEAETKVTRRLIIASLIRRLRSLIATATVANLTT
jgi:hypothetical protein